MRVWNVLIVFVLLQSCFSVLVSCKIEPFPWNPLYIFPVSSFFSWCICFWLVLINQKTSTVNEDQEFQEIILLYVYWKHMLYLVKIVLEIWVHWIFGTIFLQVIVVVVVVVLKIGHIIIFIVNHILKFLVLKLRHIVLQILGLFKQNLFLFCIRKG